jgi:hypothetical protein
MRIAEKKFYNGSERRIARLGIVMFEERISLLEELPLFISEEKDSNSGAAVRRMIDDRFAASQGWTKTVSGGIDWKKCITTTPARFALALKFRSRRGATLSSST